MLGFIGHPRTYERGLRLGIFCSVLAPGHTSSEKQNAKEIVWDQKQRMHVQLGQILDKSYKER